MQVKKHGSIIGFFLGNRPMVVLTQFDQIREAFKKESLSGRPSIPILELTKPGSELMDPDKHGSVPGIIFSHGPYWKELRRFLQRNFKDLGFGRKVMDEILQEEVDKLCHLLAKTSGIDLIVQL